MTSGPPQGANRQAEWAEARRRAARQFHPDRGGDPDQFVRAMSRVDADFATPPRGGRRRRMLPLRAILRSRYALRRRMRSGIRSVRSTLPRSIPGSRRYFEL